MYRGSPPSSPNIDKYKKDVIHNNSTTSYKTKQNLIQLLQKMLVQVISYICSAIFLQEDTSICNLSHVFWASTVVTFWVHDSYSGDA